MGYLPKKGLRPGLLDLLFISRYEWESSAAYGMEWDDRGGEGEGRGRFCPSLGSFGLKYFLLSWTVILLSKKLFCFPHCYYRVLLISVLRKEVMLWREPRGVR